MTEDYLDLHTHTIASGHAFHTINEMAAAAAEKKLAVLGITEHGPAMPGTCTDMYFMNLPILPGNKKGITVLYGVELNILDLEGRVDLPDQVLAGLDLAIASMHELCLKSGTRAENTRAYLNVMKNPYVNIIGHPDDSRYPVDYGALAEGAKENGVLLEMNNSSFFPCSSREHVQENYRCMLERCKEFETPIIINSDAHADLYVGNHDLAWKLVKETGFPKRLVVNANPEMWKGYVNQRGIGRSLHRNFYF